MINRGVGAIALGVSLCLAACGSDGGSGGSGGTSTSSAGSGGGSGGSTIGSGGSGGSTIGSGGSGGSTIGSGGTGGGACDAARDEQIKPIDMVSTGEIIVLSTTGDVMTLFVDASAGGSAAAAQNPWIYLSLATGTKVAVSDVASFTSSEWDLGLERSLLRTNGGDGGPGGGGAVFLEGKEFDAVTKADAEAAVIAVETWFDAACQLLTDEGDAIATTFAGWYDYDPATHTLAPHPGTFIVRGAGGGLYKLGLLDYYANPDGTSGMSGGRFSLRVAAVK